MTSKTLDAQPFSLEAIASARKVSMQSGRRVIDVLEEQSALEPHALIAGLAMSFGLRTLAMAELDALQPAFDVLPLADAVGHECLALRDAGNEVLVAFADPFDPKLKAWAEEYIAERFAWRLAHAADLAATLKRLERGARAVESFVDSESLATTNAEATEDISFRSLSEGDSAVVKFVNAMLYDALKSDASDIHFETGTQGLVVKYRLDGVLVQAGALRNRELAEQVISRIKVMAQLDIAERRIPQDGRFKSSIDQRAIDFRVSVMPSIFGEDAVIRILDKRALVNQTMELRLDGLGFDAHTIASLRTLASQAYGMLLMTGPTGSGKTTTVYAAITEINTGEDKIVTIEDPVEYQLPGVLQIPVNEAKGLTFARGLRSILRHDPDKILVGEIRDPETAEIAVQAALTGHLVFTTVHANNVFDVIGRFTHMGVDPYNFVSAMNGVVAQRLVRLNCARCTVEMTPAPELVMTSGLGGEDLSGFTFRGGTGCGHCRGTGYKGRKAIAEVLLLDDELRELIIARAPTRALREAAARAGTTFLREAAVDMVRRGETTLQAINHVTLA